MSDLTKAARRVSLTLTKGQELAIQNSLVFRLNGHSYARAIRHWMIDGVMKDQAENLRMKHEETMRLLKKVRE